jgi:hypothetical protein
LGHSFDSSLALKPTDDSLNEGIVLLKTFEERIHQGYNDLSRPVGKSLLNQVFLSVSYYVFPTSMFLILTSINRSRVPSHCCVLFSRILAD